MNWLLKWLLELWLRHNLRDVVNSKLPVTFFFQVRNIHGRIIVDRVD